MGWAHFSDIGGLRPGSISSDATDIFQEGIIVPPTKLIEAGTVNEAALEIFYRNSRYPEQSRGDTRALMASVDLGVRRVREILDRFGPEVMAEAFARLFARTRELVRRRLCETFAVGTHRFTDAIDSDGHGNGPFRIRLALTRTADDRFILDATETDDQAAGPVNFLMNPDVPGMALGLFFLSGDPAQVCNAGGPRALDEVRLREGSLLWPRFPAPLGLRGMTMMRFLAALNGLVNVAGGSAPAAHSAYVIIMLRGTANGRQFLMSDGARATADGSDAVYFVAQENYPVEFLELGYPVRLRRYGINRDSGGPGRFRGGAGVVREYEVLAEHAVLSMRIDSVVNPPWRSARRHRPRSGEPWHDARAGAGAAVRWQHSAQRRHSVAGDRRRRWLRSSIRQARSASLAGRRGWFRLRRGGTTRLRCSDCPRHDRRGQHRGASSQSDSLESFLPQRLCRCHRVISPSRLISAARSPT
jgi:N-methylhydantoinase B